MVLLGLYSFYSILALIELSRRTVSLLIRMALVLVIGAQQANHVSDGTCDLIQNLFAYYILAYITL